MIFTHLRVHQIFGANTDVGKTIFATILSLANATQGKRVFYLKPVSTGAPWDADDTHVKKYRPKGALISTKCLIQMDEPVSPHLAARSAKKVISDDLLLRQVREHLIECSKDMHISGDLDAAYLETAGGVLSPVPSGTTQADAYRPLRHPVVLVGDSKLGGISTTLSAYEALNSRGYDINSVVMFVNDRYRNHQYLEEWFASRGIKLLAFDPPPPPPPGRNHTKDEMNMKEYYAHTSTTANATSLIDHLDGCHSIRLSTLQSLPQRASRTLWYPFSQHKTITSQNDITVIDSAHGDFFTTTSIPTTTEPSQTLISGSQFDGSASWWTQGVGHSHSHLTATAAYASGRYGHVIFPKTAHEPAVSLAESLLHTQGKDWASRVFFSDNGSTGMEVALKMALRWTARLYDESSKDKRDFQVLGLSGSYHGDTIGAMDACEGGIYNSAVEWYKGRGFWLDPPTLGFEKRELRLRIPWSDESLVFDSLPDAYNIPDRQKTTMGELYRTYIQKEITKLVQNGTTFGALILEPLVLGAGGMKFVDPLFQAILVDVVRSMSGVLLPPRPKANESDPMPTLPVIFDEVFAGLGRLGFPSISPVLGVKPDIAVYAKLLTGGLVPLAATLASQHIFEAFLGDDKRSALLHGHSYTAYPVGCAVANTSLRLLQEMVRGESFRTAQMDWGIVAEPSQTYPATSYPPRTKPHQFACSLWSQRFVKELSDLPIIKRAMALGTVLAFELDDGFTVSGYSSTAAERLLSSLKTDTCAPPNEFSVHFRTLGDVGYLITSLTTEKPLIRRLEANLLHILEARSRRI
ncbi:hypothetical protein FRC15_004254 [Serendipita sp. 397]|nr:hypothetical protein FRC15_004254 [Serendipita sp. 397]